MLACHWSDLSNDLRKEFGYIIPQGVRPGRVYGKLVAPTMNKQGKELTIQHVHVSFVHGTNIVNNGMMVGTFAYTRHPAMSHKNQSDSLWIGKIYY